MLLSNTSVIPKLSPCLCKKYLLILAWWSSFLITNSLRAQKSTRQPANAHCCLPPTRSHPPRPNPLSSPSGIPLFSWWKRLLGSCTNELALLLNDVCKLWPSLLPMNGAETQNPHRQLGAHSHCEQSGCWVVGLNWILDAGCEFGNSIPSSLALPCGVKTNILISPLNICFLNK